MIVPFYVYKMIVDFSFLEWEVMTKSVSTVAFSLCLKPLMAQQDLKNSHLIPGKGSKQFTSFPVTLNCFLGVYLKFQQSLEN